MSSSSSSSSTTTTEVQRDGLVPGKESAVRAWLVAQGFRSAEMRQEIKSYIANLNYCHGVWMHPMARGCYKGELNVCKWLYDNGAEEDITKTDDEGYTPMHRACKGGHPRKPCAWECSLSLIHI